MKQLVKLILPSLVILLIACGTRQKLYQLYKMDELNIQAGNEFVKKIQHLPGVTEISIVDTRADGNSFIVNRQSMFLDTTMKDYPNYYHVKKRAAELNVPADSLINALHSFYRIGVNSFNKDSSYYRFGVVVGLTIHRGYLYTENTRLEPGDTLPATSVSNRNYHYKVILTKKMAPNWFEYYELIKKSRP